MRHNEDVNDAELRAQREYLGLSTRQLAQALDVNERTVNRWEYGHAPIPDGVRDEIAGWLAEADEAVGGLAEAATIVTYRTDEQYRAADPASRWPASWHRMIAARAADEFGARIVYVDGEAAS